jgi:hypothetical protein
MALGDASIGAAIAAVVVVASAAVLIHARVAKKASRRKQVCVGNAKTSSAVVPSALVQGLIDLFLTIAVFHVSGASCLGQAS